jgi:CDP-glucose 4,6-dehydratase
MPDKNFWQGKKVLVTGHTGFKGSWLCLWLQQLGAQVVGYALSPPSFPNLYTVAGVADDMQSVIGDVVNAELVKNFFQAQQPEIVFHLAAQSLVRHSYQYPQQTYFTNVLGTVNVLEAARQTPSILAVINVTSDKCYENNATLKHFQEGDALGGNDPYSSSKACAEIITAAYRHSYFSSHQSGLATARAGNVIGGGDWASDRLIPDLMNAYLNDTTFTVRFPNAVRPWQFVLEALHGYLLLAEKLAQNPANFAQAWNFGPSPKDLRNVGSVIATISKLWGKALAIQTVAEALPEMQYLGLDSSKAHVNLNWMPVWELDETLAATVAWYKAYQTNADMKIFTRQQITDYGTRLPTQVTA